MLTKKMRTVPFLNKLRVFNSDIELLVDTAGNCLLGFGCFFQGQWCQGMWRETSLFSDSYRPNIALLELFAIVIAVDLWAPELAGKSITLQSDNTATIAFINKMKVDIPACMQLLHHVTLVCLNFQILLHAVHIEGVKNLELDWISGDLNEKFLLHHPNEKQRTSTPVKKPVATDLDACQNDVLQPRRY